MSHPIPGHDYSEQHNEESNRSYAARRRSATKKSTPHKTIKDLKAMVNEPASLEWFKKHGVPKHKALSKAKKPFFPKGHIDMSGADTNDR